MEAANRSHLQTLPGEVMRFKSTESGILGPSPERTSLLHSIIVPPEVDLKIGACVVLAKNLPDFSELANGSIGTVVAFRTAIGIGEDEGILFSRDMRPSGIWPVVDFVCRSGTVYRVLILQEMFSLDGKTNEVLVSRKQVSQFLSM